MCQDIQFYMYHKHTLMYRIYYLLVPPINSTTYY